jgi:hypothetical protein
MNRTTLNISPRVGWAASLQIQNFSRFFGTRSPIGWVPDTRRPTASGGVAGGSPRGREHDVVIGIGEDNEADCRRRNELHHRRSARYAVISASISSAVMGCWRRWPRLEIGGGLRLRNRGPTAG